MTNKKVIERLRKPDWFIDCDSLEEYNILMTALMNAKLKWVDGSDCSPIESTEVDRFVVFYESKFCGVCFCEFTGNAGDKLTDLTEWFFKEIKGDDAERENKYRIKPKQTPLPIPVELWRLIDKKYVQAVVDKNTETIHFYSDCLLVKPVAVNYWVSDDYNVDCFSIKANGFNINTDGIDWRLSLTKRPEGV